MKIPRVAETEFQPRTWEEWVERLAPAPSLAKRLWGALAGLGALLLLAHAWLTLDGSRNAAADGAPSVNVTVRVTGQACLQDSSSLKDVRVVLHLPEVPLDLEKDLTEVAVNERGDYVLETNLVTAQPPTWCTVSARCPGYAARSSRELSLAGEPLEVVVPALVLTRQAPSLPR